MRRDIDEALHGWPYEPDPNEAMVAREVRARDGRNVLQIRIELGIMQLEVEGRPDGVRPHSFPTFLDYLRHRASTRNSGQGAGANKSSWTMSAEHCVEADREFVQFYRRRVAWLTLQRYDKALQDAEHSLALAEFVRKYATDPEYVALHERSRGLVLLHKTQATAALAIERRKPEESIDAIREGIERLIEHQLSIQTDSDDTPNEPFIEQLRASEREIRKDYSVEKTLREQLDEAVAEEDYELAARLRDQIKAQARR
jgi:UvrB/uvrC motif